MVIRVSEGSKLLAGVNEEYLFSNDNQNWVKLFFVGLCADTGHYVGTSFIESKLISAYKYIKNP